MATRAQIIKRAIAKVAAQPALKLTKSNFFVESNAAAGLLSLHFLGGKENAVLLLERSFSL